MTSLALLVRPVVEGIGEVHDDMCDCRLSNDAPASRPDPCCLALRARLLDALRKVVEASHTKHCTCIHGLYEVCEQQRAEALTLIEMAG